MRFLRWLTVTFVCVVALPEMAQAQASIAGAVRDTSGAVLPGVTIEASSTALIEKARSVVTDGTGQYQIVDLRPGTYTVTFTLSGFAAVKREGIVLTGAFAATVNAELKVGTVSETITVTGLSPIVDVQSTAQERVISADLIAALPAGRSIFNAAPLIPGLQTSQGAANGTLMDVGGTNNLKLASMTIHGGRSTDTRTMIDGLRIGNIAGAGQTTNYLPDLGSTQEIAIDYASGSAENPTAGLRVNLIPREGGNTFRASFFGTAVNSSFQGNNLDDALTSRGLGVPNSMKRAYDFNPSGGGPILPNKLWFYSGGRFQNNEAYIAGLYKNLNAGNPQAWTYVPDLSQQATFAITQKGVNNRLTWQASQKNKVSVFYEEQSRVWDDGRAGVSPEAVVKWRFPTLRLVQGGWTAPLTNRLLLEARVSNRGEVYNEFYPPEGDVIRSLIPVTEQAGLIPGLIYRAPGAVNGGGGYDIQNMPNINTVLGSISYVTGSHALKVGFTDTWGTRTTTKNDNCCGLSYRFSNGVPNQITERSTPWQTVTTLRGEIALYAQDKWTLDRLTLNGGIRVDSLDFYFPEQALGPSSLLPTRNLRFSETQGPAWKTLTPRVGASYDLFGNGNTAVKVALGKYMLAGDPSLAYNNPVSSLATLVTRSWSDGNRNYTPDCDLVSPLSNGECGAISDATFGALRPSTTYDPQVLGGWNTSPYNWEFSASVQHELLPRVGLNVSYFRRWYGNFTVTDNRAVAASDYGAFSVTTPVDPRLPGGGGSVIRGLYDLNPNKVGQVDNYVTSADTFGSQIEHWNGIDVTVNARLAQGAVLQGGMSTGRTSTDNCEVLAQVPEIGPTTLPYCHVDTRFLTQVKLLGTYAVPRVNVNLAATFQSVPGQVIAANYNVPTAQVQPSLGRPLSGGAANVAVNLVAPGTQYVERVNQLDLRVSKPFVVGRARTSLNVDLYNALNGNTVLLQNDNYASWQTPQKILEARLLKFSVQFDF